MRLASLRASSFALVTPAGALVAPSKAIKI